MRKFDPTKISWFQLIMDLAHSFCYHFLPFTRRWLDHEFYDWNICDELHRLRFCVRCGYQEERLKKYNEIN